MSAIFLPANRHRRVFLVALALQAAVVQPASARPEASVACAIPGYDDKCEQWVRAFDHPANGAFGYEETIDLAISPDGRRAYVTGTTSEAEGPQGETDIVTAAYDLTEGSLVWSSVYDGDEDGNDRPAGLAVGPDGTSVYVAGTVNDVATDEGYRDSDAGVLAYDAATGAMRWHYHYDGAEAGQPVGANDIADIAVSPDGSRVYAIGRTLVGNFRVWDYATFALEAADGELLWLSRYDRGKGYDIPVGLALSPDGSRVYVTGYSDRFPEPNKPDGNYDAVTIAYEAADPNSSGETVWMHRRDAWSADVPRDVAITPDGSTLLLLMDKPVLAVGDRLGALVIGISTESGGAAFSAEVTSSSGPLFGTDLAVSPSGDRFFISGTRHVPLTPGIAGTRDMDLFTAGFRLKDGGFLWSSFYAFPGGTEEEGADVAVSPDANTVFVTGYSSEVTYTYIPVVTTVAYDAASGAQRWAARNRRQDATDDHDSPVAASPTPDGKRLLVAGTFTYRPDLEHRKLASSDIGLVSYDLTR